MCVCRARQGTKTRWKHIRMKKPSRIVKAKASSKGLESPQRVRNCKLRHSTLCLAHITLPWGCAAKCSGELQHACGRDPALLTGSSGPTWWVARGFRFSPMLLIPLEKVPANTCKATSFVFFPVCPHTPPWAQEWQGWRWAWQPTQQATTICPHGIGTALASLGPAFYSVCGVAGTMGSWHHSFKYRHHGNGKMHPHLPSNRAAHLEPPLQ